MKSYKGKWLRRRELPAGSRTHKIMKGRLVLLWLHDPQYREHPRLLWNVWKDTREQTLEAPASSPGKGLLFKRAKARSE
jgi:hypothetical protein